MELQLCVSPKSPTKTRPRRTGSRSRTAEACLESGLRGFLLKLGGSQDYSGPNDCDELQDGSGPRRAHGLRAKSRYVEVWAEGIRTPGDTISSLPWKRGFSKGLLLASSFRRLGEDGEQQRTVAWGTVGAVLGGGWA
uniref:Uncharacterized protein n=1 Tax=Knipowitschia caucasica TaxID=637954 RepID=A0AAV2KNY0_KNICA